MTSNSKERKGYQWPASSLRVEEMRILSTLREKTGLPICRLLQECVLKIGIEAKI